MADGDSVLRGTLDLIILHTIETGPEHGWGIVNRIRARSGEVFQVNHGSLYLSLERMQAKGWITSQWGETENGRKARYYAITASGERHLAKRREEWSRTAAAMTLVLSPVRAG